DIVSCSAVFEPNGENARISLQVQPQGDTFIFGKDAPPQFVGGGSLTQLTLGAEMPNGEFQASCEGKIGLTAVPFKTTNGPIIWLASVDLSNAVWKAPAGMEVAEFFSENGYRSILLMTTDVKMDVPETAVSYAYDLNPNDLSAYDLNPNDLSAYDLNPNDLSVTDPRCSGVLYTSDADIGPIFFETLIGISGMLVLGDGNSLGSVQAQGTGASPFVCDDSNKVQIRSADLELGESPYQLIELLYPEITVQTADGEKVTLTDVTTLGIIHLPQQK
ncbi:MAG: hypothetical protein GY943_01615, partial [Chloroflexi bacterium]|nr:hypothetical protein [Chloroflexota bacterium]